MYARLQYSYSLLFWLLTLILITATKMFWKYYKNDKVFPPPFHHGQMNHNTTDILHFKLMASCQFFLYTTC